MSIWLFRAGRNGEYESKFLEDKRIYLTIMTSLALIYRLRYLLKEYGC